MEGYSLHALVFPDSRLLGSLVVEMPLALLHCPLQLPREDAQIVVALQAVAVSENVDDELRARHPEAAIGHGRQADGDPTSSFFVIFMCLSALRGWLGRASVLCTISSGCRFLF